MKLSPAQRANQITFVLKGHLKNAQIAYLRVAALLAKVRDEGLYAALKHETLEDYAAARLGLQKSSLYHYLQIYDWARKLRPGCSDRGLGLMNRASISAAPLSSGSA